LKWNDTFAELLGETVPFLHAILMARFR